MAPPKKKPRGATGSQQPIDNAAQVPGDATRSRSETVYGSSEFIRPKTPPKAAPAAGSAAPPAPRAVLIATGPKDY